MSIMNFCHFFFSPLTSFSPYHLLHVGSLFPNPANLRLKIFGSGEPTGTGKWWAVGEGWRKETTLPRLSHLFGLGDKSAPSVSCRDRGMAPSPIGLIFKLTLRVGGARGYLSHCCQWLAVRQAELNHRVSGWDPVVCVWTIPPGDWCSVKLVN